MTSLPGAGMLRLLRRATWLGVVAVACVGCATRPGGDPRDPFESFNRGMFVFNEDLDRIVFKPAASVYAAVTPALVRTGVGNFLGNLEDVWSFVNSLLQAKGQAAAQTFMRVNINTVMGLGGVLDIASEMRLERQREDFGQTLGYWGMSTGPYLVLPLLGPSSVRDTFGMLVDGQGDIVSNIDHVRTRNSIKLVDLLDTRAGLLRAGEALDEVALDKYSFVRDGFLQRRRNAVFDGNPPEEPAPANVPRR